MLQIYGNLWNFHELAPVCVTTNGILKKNGELVMGAGIALQAKQYFRALPGKAGIAVEMYGNHCFYFMEERIFTFPTKHDWRDPSDITLIERSCHELVQITDNNNFHRVYLPRPGCANGQLEWEEVRDVIEPILDNRFTVVSLPGGIS